MASDAGQNLRAYVEYFRDLGVYDFYRREGDWDVLATERLEVAGTAPAILPVVAAATETTVLFEDAPVEQAVKPSYEAFSEGSIPRPLSFDELAPLPAVRVEPRERAAALRILQDEIGDCTRCPLAYAGRRSIVFGDGSPQAG